MIAYGNNIYRTLDQKFFIGDKQIGKVYKGTELIYPENKIVIDDIEIDISPYYLNGNMYDTGYKPTRNTRFEICFTANTNNAESVEFFGTHHDNGYYAQYTYLLANDGESRGTVIDKNGGYTSSNDFNYLNQTKYHLLFRNDGKLSFRFGGQQGQSSGENIIDNTEEKKQFFVVFDDEDKLYADRDFGPYYYKSRNINHSYNVNKKIININNYSATNKGGNLWLNAVNSKMANPNTIMQPECPTIENNKLKFTATKNDIKYYHATSNSAFHYLILWEKGNDATKVMFKQAILQIDQTHSIYVFEKHESELRNDGKYHFKKEISKTIYPFYYCNPIIPNNQSGS